MSEEVKSNFKEDISITNRSFEPRKSDVTVRMAEFAHEPIESKPPQPVKKKGNGLVKEPGGEGLRPMKNRVKETTNRVILDYDGNLDKEPKNEYTHEPIIDSSKVKSELLKLPNSLLKVDYMYNPSDL